MAVIEQIVVQGAFRAHEIVRGARQAVEALEYFERRGAGISQALERVPAPNLAPAGQAAALSMGQGFARQIDRDFSRSGAVGRSTQVGVSHLRGMLATLGLTVGAGAVVRGLIDINRQLQRFQAQLQTTEGSMEGARAAFRMVEDFASSTPFQIENLVDSFVQLRVRGVEPSVEMLRGLGNVAASMSRDITDVAGAINSAAAGMTQPLKGLGFEAQVSGNRIRVAFGEIERTVARTPAAIAAGVAEIGNLRLGGAMEREMNTINGAISNLWDNVGILARSIGEAGGLNEQLLAGAQYLRDVAGRVAENEEEIRRWTQATIEAGRIAGAVFGGIGRATLQAVEAYQRLDPTAQRALAALAGTYLIAPRVIAGARAMAGAVGILSGPTALAALGFMLTPTGAVIGSLAALALMFERVRGSAAGAPGDDSGLALFLLTN